MIAVSQDLRYCNRIWFRVGLSAPPWQTRRVQRKNWVKLRPVSRSIEKKLVRRADATADTLQNRADSPGAQDQDLPLVHTRVGGLGGVQTHTEPLRPASSPSAPASSKMFFQKQIHTKIFDNSSVTRFHYAGKESGADSTRAACGMLAADRQTLLQLIVEIVQELRKYHSGESKRLQLSGRQDYSLGRRAVSDYGAYPEEQRVEIVPRDLRMKDKFLKHLTGPLYFSPKCSKHFHRLYHNTRDCTIPACK
ncbi:hypothetical protein E2I00_001673 [Balaenoptera physalus]|uniref:ALK and LTK ligand 2 n=1 Tax=Balaenoptera physalus TaxID=9770 RepID=A0A643BNE3_BALPH|nr:hypothetical protein E2I00_001673 [Balaenoptera physalus]